MRLHSHSYGALAWPLLAAVVASRALGCSEDSTSVRGSGAPDAESAGGTGGSPSNEGGPPGAGGSSSDTGGASNTGGAVNETDGGASDYVSLYCTRLVDRYIACGTLDASVGQTSIDQCISNASGSPVPTFTDQFSQAFSACAQTLACDELQSMDDICFPAAVAELNAGTLPENVVTECGGGSSEICASLVPTEVTGNDAVSTCLRKWVECTTASAFTEDDCLSLFAFDASTSESIAADCLALECTAAGTCLRDHGTINW